MAAIEGMKFDCLLNAFEITNTDLAIYLQCDRTTIINRRKTGIHEFSKEQIDKLDNLFRLEENYTFSMLCDLVYDDIDFSLISRDKKAFVKESLKIVKKLRKYEEYLLSYRLIKDIENPVKILPKNRHKHIEFINRVSENTLNIELLYNQMNKSNHYFLTSEKFLEKNNFRQGYILSVSIKYKNKYQKTDPNKLISFSLSKVDLTDEPLNNIDDLYNNGMCNDKEMGEFEKTFFGELPKYYNDLLAISNTECYFNEFIDKLSLFNRYSGKKIIMFLDDEDDEYDYMMNNLDSRRRRKLEGVNIYKLNNMFGKAYDRYLNIFEALDLYNFKYDKDNILSEPRYKNVAINALINKLFFKYGGGKKAYYKSILNSEIHISYRSPESDKLESKYVTMKEEIILQQQNVLDSESKLQEIQDIEQKEKLKRQVLFAKERFDIRNKEMGIEAYLPSQKEEYIKNRRNLKMKRK